jgi:hypothetical protein
MNLYAVKLGEYEYCIEAPRLLTALRLWHMARDEEQPARLDDEEPDSVRCVSRHGVIRVEDFPPQPAPLGEEQSS